MQLGDVVKKPCPQCGGAEWDVIHRHATCETPRKDYRVTVLDERCRACGWQKPTAELERELDEMIDRAESIARTETLAAHSRATNG